MGNAVGKMWARTGYAAWNPYVRDRPAKLHSIRPAALREGSWITDCGMLYDELQVDDARDLDTRCGRCERAAR